MKRIYKIDLIEGDYFYCEYLAECDEVPGLMECNNLLVIGHNNTQYKYLRWTDVDAKKYVPKTKIKEILYFGIRPGSLEPIV